MENVLVYNERTLGKVFVPANFPCAVICSVTRTHNQLHTLCFVQSSEPHCPPSLAEAALTASFCGTASLPVLVDDFLFSYSCNPPMYPSSVAPCLSARLRNQYDPSGNELTYVYTRHLSTGDYCSHSGAEIQCVHLLQVFNVCDHSVSFAMIVGWE